MVAQEEKTVRKRKRDDIAHAADAYVGSRIRLRRAIVGYSQERLAEEVGITFQQVQKYEHGQNRVSAGRLWKLAKVLGVSVNFFFDGMENNLNEYQSSSLTGNAPMAFCEEAPTLGDDVLSRKDILELIRYYLLISDEKVARSVIDLLKSMSGSTSVSDTENTTSY